MTRAASRRITRLKNSLWLRIAALCLLAFAASVALDQLGLVVSRLVS